MTIDPDILKHSAWSSHAPVVMACAAINGGDVLELGAGLYSTPQLHCLCAVQGRRMLTLETNADWLEELAPYRCGWHEMRHSPLPHEEADLSRPFGMALVDTAAGYRRACIERLHHVPLVIVHDTEDAHAHSYKWDGVLETYKYRADFVVEPWTWLRTTVLSDTVGVDTILAPARLPA
jgi:hypothetical protein